MRILVIGWNRFGDAVISTALFHQLSSAHPDARFTVVCGALAAEVLRPMPRLEKLMVIGKHRLKVPILPILREIAGRRWDLVIDLKDTFASRIVRAPRTLVWRRPHALPTAAALAELLGTKSLAAPGLWLDEARQRRAAAVVSGRGPLLALGVGASNRDRCWPVASHAEIARRFLDRFKADPNAAVMVSGSPAEADLADAVLSGVPPDRRLDLTRALPPILDQCACLAHATAFVGNDSGFMHAAAALEVPTVGIFGPSPAGVFQGLYARLHPVTPPGNRIAPIEAVTVDAVWSVLETVLPTPRGASRWAGAR